jgi:hypothetical protein
MPKLAHSPTTVLRRNTFLEGPFKDKNENKNRDLYF